MQAVHADPIPHRKIIRAWLEPVTRKNTTYALALVAADLAAFALAMTAVVLLPHPALQLLAAPVVAAMPLRAITETAIVALGLLAPCLVAFSVVAPGWRRAVMVLGALTFAVAGMTLSTLLNFGPEHAGSWIGARTVPGLVVGSVLALLCTPLPRRMVAGVGLVVLTALVALVTQAPDNPYFAQSLQAWEQGRFVRFHGLAQWIGWLWPYAAVGWMLSRLSSAPGRR